MSQLGEQIRRARKARDATQDDLAKHLKINRVSVAQWEGRGNSPEPAKLPAIADFLSVSVDWLLSDNPVVPPIDGELTRIPLDEFGRELVEPDSPPDGEGYSRDHYVPKVEGAIPELDAKAGAGEGAVGEVLAIPAGPVGTVSAHRIVDEWKIPNAWLREAVHDPARAIVLEIQGDSMLPNYAPGDRVVIDLSVTELGPDGVYLITDGNSPPQIKRLQRIMFTIPQRVRIISDNAAYTPVETDKDAVYVLGKISAYIGRR